MVMRVAWCGSVLAVGLLAAGAARADDAKMQKEMAAQVDKAIKAVGGAPKLKKFAACTWKVKATLAGGNKMGSMTMDGSVQGFDKGRLEVTIEAGGGTRNALLVVNGDRGWLREGNEVKKLPADITPAVRTYFHTLRLAQLLAPLKGKDYKLSSLGEVKIDDKPAVGVKATRKGYSEVDFFFDKKTHLLVKCQVQVNEGNNQEF